MVIFNSFLYNWLLQVTSSLLHGSGAAIHHLGNGTIFMGKSMVSGEEFPQTNPLRSLKKICVPSGNLT